MIKNNIGRFRTELGKTKIDVAREIGISRGAYYRYEGGKRVPDAITALILAKALHTTVEKLWGCNLTA